MLMCEYSVCLSRLFRTHSSCIQPMSSVVETPLTPRRPSHSPVTPVTEASVWHVPTVPRVALIQVRPHANNFCQSLFIFSFSLICPDKGLLVWFL